MTSGDTTNVTYSLLCLVLVGSALLSRRLPLGQTLKMIAAWVGIFAAVFLVFLFRPEFKALWQRVKADISGSAVSAEGQMIVRKSEDGHFYVDAQVNGQELRFLIDSGATVTSLSPSGASEAGVLIDEDAFPVVVETANGVTTEKRATAATFQVGPIQRSDFAVHVGQGLGETNIIGMNFLSTLRGWQVRGEELVLNP